MAGALLLAAGCVNEPSAVTGEKQAYGYSWQQELQLGEQTDQQISEQMGLYDDPEIQSYVAAVGQRVLETSDLRSESTPELYQNTDFTFRVLDSPVVNAFALPGGYVYVTRGLLTHVQNEAQLAVVLGHEIAHVAARHSSRQAWRSQLSQLGLVGAAIVGQQVLGGSGQDVAGNILQMGGQALQLMMLRYSRDAEHESDELGVRYAAGAGYATVEGAEFFRTLERMSAKEGRALPSWSSTHPDPGQRRERVRELSARWNTIGGSEPIVREQEFLQRLEGMILGDNPREGFERDGRFLHPELAFQFDVPNGWQLQNERAIVILAEPSGAAMMGFQLVPVASPAEAAQQLAQQQGVQVVSAEETRINGQPAMVVLGQAQAEQGILALLAAFIQRDERVYSFLGYTSAQAFPTYQPIFQQVAQSFAPLTDRAVLQIQPARLEVVRLDRATRFRDLVPAVLPEGLSAEDLAVLNQVELDESLPAGSFIKLPSR